LLITDLCAESILGANIPCVLEFTSNIAELSAAVPVVLIATPWAFATTLQNNIYDAIDRPIIFIVLIFGKITDFMNTYPYLKPELRTQESAIVFILLSFFSFFSLTV
jgi:hypothetical protein